MSLRSENSSVKADPKNKQFRNGIFSADFLKFFGMLFYECIHLFKYAIKKNYMITSRAGIGHLMFSTIADRLFVCLPEWTEVVEMFMTKGRGSFFLYIRRGIENDRFGVAVLTMMV